MKTRIASIALTAVALVFPSVASATPRPDPPPAAHGKPVTVLPACPVVPLPWNARDAYVEIWDGNTIICASLERSKHTTTLVHFGSYRNHKEQS